VSDSEAYEGMPGLFWGAGYQYRVDCMKAAAALPIDMFVA